jgi:DNA-binding NarL/FixJ family response regulator
MTTRTSVVIADDHPLFRKGLREAIEEDASLEVIGEASDGETALAIIEQRKPDVAVLDIDMPALKGFQVARAVQDKGLHVAVIILTIYQEEDMFNAAIDSGARGYILKESAIVDVLKAIKTVTMGEYFFSPAIAGYLVKRSQRVKDLLKKKPALESLTSTERRVLQLVASDKTSKEIASELNVSPRTVETHRANIATKLGIHGTNSLLKFALQNRSALSE